MRKIVKIFTFAVVFALFASLLMVSAYAAGCEGEEKNIASDSVVTGDTGPGTDSSSVFWGVWDHYKNAVDGNPETVCPIDTVHWRNYGLWINFNEEYDLTRIVIQTHGRGRAETSQVITNTILARHGSFTLQVTLYDGAGAEIDSFNETASDGKNIEILIDDAVDPVGSIYIYFTMNDAAQGIWEVEAYTLDNHDWEDQGQTEAPKCVDTGLGKYKCADCGEEKFYVIPATGHTDTCKGTCDKCGVSLEIKHIQENCMSTTCPKCGKNDLPTAAHKASIDPCDDKCTVCKVAGTITPKHIASADPCSNDCARCGAKGVIPNKGDAGSWWSTGTVLPSSYAPHVQNPNDPCDSKCYKCQKEGVVVAPHVADPDDPCHAKDCFVCGEKGVFAKSRIGGGDDYAHQRIDGQMEINGTIQYECSRWCAKCKSNFKLAWGHEFDNCGDTTCNLCNSTSCPINERDHTFDPEKPTECKDCDYQTASWDLGTECVEHVYENETCSTACKNCGAIRWGWRGPHDEEWHVTSDDCDVECNYCGKAVNAVHNIKDFDCATVCQTCGLTRVSETPHTYSNFKDGGGVEIVGSSVCDADCDICGETRVVSHNYAYVCAPICRTCFQSNTNAAHSYTNDCDASCNTEGCSFTRAIAEESHKFTNDCDASCNTEGCTFTRTIADTTHKFTNDCDASCDTEGCTFTRTVAAHVYKNACDADCNVCGATRTVADHVYDNACDADCNVCGATRTVADHAYDNSCDTTCNVCGATRAIEHTWGEWVTTTEAQVGVAGEKTSTCSVCGATKTEAIEALVEEGGLGTGAVIAIVASSVVAVGGGGFSIWWFILRKKILG